MGADKAGVAVAGRPMVEWVADAARSVGEAVVVGGSGPTGGLDRLDDAPGGRGPLSGLVVAQGAYPGRPVLLLAVDQPAVQPETLQRLAARRSERPVVPVDDGVAQVTCALYPTATAATAREVLATGGSLQALIGTTGYEAVDDWRTWGEDGRSWFSVDTPDDIAAAEVWLGA